MKDIIIVGASGFGMELEEWISHINEIKPTWNILGFIDDNLNALDGKPSDYKVIGTIKDWQPKDSESFVLGLAAPNTKKKVVELLKSKGAKFATIIHPTALISKFAEIGEGVVITQRSGLNANAKVGDFVSILESVVGHDASVGDFSTLSGNVSVNGNVKVGSMVYAGCGSMIAPGKKVGDGAQIGIGTVVISNVKAGATVFGNPAKKIEI